MRERLGKTFEDPTEVLNSRFDADKLYNPAAEMFLTCQDQISVSRPLCLPPDPRPHTETAPKPPCVIKPKDIAAKSEDTYRKLAKDIQDLNLHVIKKKRFGRNNFPSSLKTGSVTSTLAKLSNQSQSCAQQTAVYIKSSLTATAQTITILKFPQHQHLSEKIEQILIVSETPQISSVSETLKIFSAMASNEPIGVQLVTQQFPIIA